MGASRSLFFANGVEKREGVNVGKVVIGRFSREGKDLITKGVLDLGVGGKGPECESSDARSGFVASDNKGNDVVVNLSNVDALLGIFAGICTDWTVFSGKA